MAYYIRDFVHQAVGAAVLGTIDELYQMYHTFVSHVDEHTGWYAPWAFNFDHSIYYMDTPNDDRFVGKSLRSLNLLNLLTACICGFVVFLLYFIKNT